MLCSASYRARAPLPECRGVIGAVSLSVASTGRLEPALSKRLRGGVNASSGAHEAMP